MDDLITDRDDTVRPFTEQQGHRQRAGVYVYCVVPGECWPNGESGNETQGVEGMQKRGIGDLGDRIRIVHAGDLAALVSDSPRLRYSISRHNVMAHERVIEAAMTRSDVLPMQFGRIAADDWEVREALLGEQGRRLRELLDTVRGKVELGLKVLWGPGQPFAEIVVEDATIRRLRDATLARADFSQRLRLGQLVESAMVRKQEQQSQRLLAELQPHVADIRLNPAPPDMLVLNAAFLVERTKVDPFDTVVDQIAAQDTGRLIYRSVGPLPPYSFVSVDMNGWERSGERVE